MYIQLDNEHHDVSHGAGSDDADGGVDADGSKARRAGRAKVGRRKADSTAKKAASALLVTLLSALAVEAPIVIHELVKYWLSMLR